MINQPATPLVICAHVASTVLSAGDKSETLWPGQLRRE
jgi:hypothetical protein